MTFNPSPLAKKIENIVIALAAIFILNTLVLWIFGGLSNSPDYKLIAPDAEPWQVLIGGCILAPLIEEGIFRYGIFEFARQFSAFDKIKFPLMILSSVLFGWLHGSFFNVWIQGMAGFMLAWVYLRNNHSYWSSVIVHGIWNFMLMYWLPNMVYHPTSIFSF